MSAGKGGLTPTPVVCSNFHMNHTLTTDTSGSAPLQRRVARITEQFRTMYDSLDGEEITVDVEYTTHPGDDTRTFYMAIINFDNNDSGLNHVSGFILVSAAEGRRPKFIEQTIWSFCDSHRTKDLQTAQIDASVYARLYSPADTLPYRTLPDFY